MLLYPPPAGTNMTQGDTHGSETTMTAAAIGQEAISQDGGLCGAEELNHGQSGGNGSTSVIKGRTSNAQI